MKQSYVFQIAVKITVYPPHSKTHNNNNDMQFNLEKFLLIFSIIVFFLKLLLSLKHISRGMLDMHC